MKQDAKKLQRAIYEIKPPMASDDLIGNYKDFLKHGHFLPYMQFNEKVFMSLITLTLQLWKSNEKINRMLLLDTTKRYYKKRIPPKYILSEACLSLMVELYSKVILHGNPRYIETRSVRLKWKVNTLLLGVAFPEKHLPWFFEHAAKSNDVLTRVLRYPKKSKLITDWVRENFANDAFRLRRAEMLGWILDEDKNYLISKQILTDDFNYMNVKDKAAIEIYEQITTDRMRQWKPTKRTSSYLDGDALPEFNPKINEPLTRLQLIRRFYSIPYSSSIESCGLLKYTRSFPDFEKLNKQWHQNINTYQRMVMGWGISNSRLSLATKAALLKKYYKPDVYHTYFAIGKKIKSAELLKRIQEVSLNIKMSGGEFIK